jgi:ABC-2 type transport system permease protein
MGYVLTVAHPVLFVLSLLFTVIAFVAFGLVMAPVFLISPVMQHFNNAIEFPVYLLAGFLFPIALLPSWTTPLSYILPPYWAARALHEAAHGKGDLAVVMGSWAILLLVAGFCLLVSRRFFVTILRRAREDGTLSLA